MPIEVRHGTDIAPLAAFAALASQLSATKPREPQLSHAGGGGGGGGGSRRSSLMPQAGSTGPGRQTLEEQLREKTYATVKAAEFMLPLELEKKRQEAAIAADEWEAKYTGKQQAEIARLNSGKQQIRASETLSPEEKQRAIETIDMQIAGIEPSLIPKTSEQKQMDAWASEGKGIGDVWEDETTGCILTRGPDGKPTLILRPDQTMQHLKSKLAGDGQNNREKWIREYAAKMLDSTDQLGNQYTPQQVSAMIEKVDAVVANLSGAQQAEAQPAQPQVPWWRGAIQAGAEVEPTDLDLPEEIGKAVAFNRTVVRRFPKGIPGGMKDVLMQFKWNDRIIREFEKQQAEGSEAPPISMGELQQLQSQRGDQQQTPVDLENRWNDPFMPSIASGYMGF